MEKIELEIKTPTGADELKWIRPATQKRSQKNLEAILNAAKQLTVERPFDTLSVVEICELADCSLPAFYRRFEDKESLLHVLHARHTESVVATVQNAMNLDRWKGYPLEDIVIALIDLLARTNSQASGLRLSAAQRAVEDNLFAERIRRARIAVFEGIKGLLMQRRHEFAHPDPDLAARFLIKVTYGVLTRHFEGATVDAQVHPMSEKEELDELCRAAIAYLEINK